MDETHAEGMAAMHVLGTLLNALRVKGTLTTPEIDHLLEQASFPLSRSTEERSQRASALIGELRVRVRSS